MKRSVNLKKVISNPPQSSTSMNHLSKTRTTNREATDSLAGQLQAMKTGGLTGSPTVTKKKKKTPQAAAVAVAQTAEADSDESDTDGSVDDDTSETDTETEDEGDD